MCALFFIFAVTLVRDPYCGSIWAVYVVEDTQLTDMRVDAFDTYFPPPA
jgi:hypothetical protein